MTPPVARRRRLLLPLGLLAVSLVLLAGALTARALRGEQRADRQGSHLAPGTRLTWTLSDGSKTVYLIKSVGPDGAVAFERLRYDAPAAGSAGEPSSREERTFQPIPVATFTTLNYGALGSTFQARADRLQVGRVVFDCAVVRVWRKQSGEEAAPPSVYEEWIPVDGDQVVFPGCALRGEDPPGTPLLRLTSVE